MNKIDCHGLFPLSDRWQTLYVEGIENLSEGIKSEILVEMIIWLMPNIENVSEWTCGIFEGNLRVFLQY